MKRSRVTGLNGWPEERGIALATAMFSLVVIGGFVSAVFFVAVTEQRLGWNMMQAQGTLAIAEGGAADVLSDWEAVRYNRMAVGARVDVSGRAVGGTGSYRATVRRLNDLLFFIAAEASSPDSGSRQAVGLLVRLNPLDLGINAALKVRGSVRIGTSSFVNGMDESPAGWNDCPSPGAALPAIGLPPEDSAGIDATGCPGYGCLSGSPKIRSDSTIGEIFPADLGDASLSDLVALSSKTLPAGSYVAIGPSVTATGGCDLSAPLNWGDPVDRSGPCGAYAPLVVISGNARVSGGAGQGVLVVDGDLAVDGGFRFYGAVIVVGTLSLTGAGGVITGGVAAGGAWIAPSSVLGQAVVSYSSCALRRALLATATAAPLTGRSWVSTF